MSIDQKLLLPAMYDAIYDTFTTGPAGSGSSPLSRSRNYFCMSFPGPAIDPGPRPACSALPRCTKYCPVDLSHPCFARKEERWPTTLTSGGFRSSSGG